MKECGIDCFECPFAIPAFMQDGGIDDVCDYGADAIMKAKKYFVESIRGIPSDVVADIIMIDDVCNITKMHQNISNLDEIIKLRDIYFEMKRIEFTRDLYSDYTFIS